jgi:hypothetical protein
MRQLLQSLTIAFNVGVESKLQTVARALNPVAAKLYPVLIWIAKGESFTYA